MKYRYFKTFCFLNKNTQIAEDEVLSRNLYYRFYFDPELSIEIGERFLNGKFDQVFYKDGIPEIVQRYHQEKFPDSPEYCIIQNLNELTIIIKIYKDRFFNGAEIYNYNSKFEQVENLIFDRDFRLQEFHSNIDDEEQIKRRIFLAYDWRILEDY